MAKMCMVINFLYFYILISFKSLNWITNVIRWVKWLSELQEVCRKFHYLYSHFYIYACRGVCWWADWGEVWSSIWHTSLWSGYSWLHAPCASVLRPHSAALQVNLWVVFPLTNIAHFAGDIVHHEMRLGNYLSSQPTGFCWLSFQIVL